MIAFYEKIEPYLYVKTSAAGCSEARIRTQGLNNITLPFVPSLSDRSKDPSEFISSLPQYKRHESHGITNVFPTVLYHHSNIEGSGVRINPILPQPPTTRSFADNADKHNATQISWVRKLLRCVSSRKVLTGPYVSYDGSDSALPLVRGA